VDAVKRMQAAGIDVVLFMVLGARNDTREDFERAVELADRLDVGVHPVLLTPLPGTELYAEYAPHLLPGLGWDAYNGTRAVFEHPTMSPQEREAAYFDASLRLSSVPRVLGRAARLPLAGFPGAHMMALTKALPMRRAMKRAHAEWAASSQPDVL
jgi:hypothetical protein